MKMFLTAVPLLSSRERYTTDRPGPLTLFRLAHKESDDALAALPKAQTENEAVFRP